MLIRFAVTTAPSGTFMGMPKELRLDVYRNLLKTHCKIRTSKFGYFITGLDRRSACTDASTCKCGGVHHYIDLAWVEDGALGISTSILGVSQQIYSEAVTILYRENVFDSNALKLISSVINPASFDMIRHLTIKISNLEQADLPFSTPKGLKTSTILYDISTTSFSGSVPVREVKHENVVANIKRIQAAVEVKPAIRLFQLQEKLDESIKEGLEEVLARV